MAKHFFHGKRRGTLVALSAALCATLSLGMLAACGETADAPNGDDDDEESVASATDTQLLRNGNFEFFSERETKPEDKRAFISSPTSWSFTSGSPSSITSSGIVKADEWKTSLSVSTYRLVPAGAEDEIGTGSTSFTAKELTDEAAAEAEAHWEEASVYDRLLFYKYYGVDSNDDFSLYKDYKYSIDYEDVQYFAGDLGEDGLTLREGAKENETGVLMIHNKRESDDVLGTAQYYTSSTTITLEAGTAAEISVWVRTDKLYHWFDADHTDGDKEEVKSKGGAYIGVINTVGGQTLPEMQVKNIRTDGAWENYTFYVRANTYASTTFRLKLGLGQGTSSSNRYEMVDGYAFFDDVTVKKMKASAYETATAAVAADHSCSINSESKQKIFDRDTQTDSNVYALDLLSDDFVGLTAETLTGDNFDVGLTSEKVSENKTYYSYVKDNRDEAKEGEKADGQTPAEQQSVVGMMTYKELREKAQTNGYLKNVFNSDFSGKFPFGTSETRDSVPVLLLLSTNGAAYTAKLTGEGENGVFTLAPNSRKLISFFVKTWSVRSGRQGAGVTLVDGEEKTSITPFDTTTIDPVTVDENDPELTDIYQGWVQCFFIVANETDSEKSFSLNFTYGVTEVQGTDESSYGDGYAAFTDFKVMDLTKTQYSYASTGTYAQKVSLKAYAENDAKFDSAEASSNIKEELAAPSSFRGALAGSNIFEQGGATNEKPAGIEAGLLNKDYAATYMKKNAAWATALNEIAGTETDPTLWWGKIFGENGGTSAREARQPLVLINTNKTATASYGFINRTMETTIAANTSQRITVRVKVKEGTTAYLYLLDTSDLTNGLNTMLAPSVPKNTYWYDDEGNILRCDPESDAFDKSKDVLYYLEASGLYSAAADAGKADRTLYANLANYSEDDDKNLVTSDEVTAFYYNAADGKYYGYRTEESDGKYTYSQPVEPLPTQADGKSILRYTGPESAKQYESVIAVTGNADNADQWVDVNFYVRTGSTQKTYRLELWAGDRTNATDGFPAGGYVFFDAYSSGSISNFETLRDSETGAKGLLLENDANKDADDEEKLTSALALYYTFTFYDSTSYLRHDREHEEVNYNKWENYKQSSYSEGTVWLKCFDEDGTLYGKAPSYSVYLDYTPLEVSVTAYEPEEDVEEETPEEDTDTPSETNIWLVLSSSLLAIVTLVAVAAVIIRAIRKKHKGSAPVKKANRKEKKVKASKPTPAAPEAPEAKDENDPYND